MLLSFPQDAERRWNATLEWRRVNHIDHILKEPQEHFWTIKELFPHFLHGRSVRDADGRGAGVRMGLNGCCMAKCYYGLVLCIMLRCDVRVFEWPPIIMMSYASSMSYYVVQGYPIYYQQLYKIDFTQLKERGVSKEHLLRHAIFLKEYIFTHVEPSDEDGQIITVLDVKGMGLADLAGEALELWKAHSKILQNHYVERSHQIFVVNASSMFRMVWKVVKPMLSPLTRKKVKIFREGSSLMRLSRCVGAQQLPEEYGGSPGVQLGASEEERMLELYVTRLNSSTSMDKS